MAAVAAIGVNEHGRTPTMTLKPAIWAAALLAYAAGNLLVAIDTVVPGGGAQLAGAGLVTAIAAAFSLVLLRNLRANKQIVDQYIRLLRDEHQAHLETRAELLDTQKRLTTVERELIAVERELARRSSGPSTA